MNKNAQLWCFWTGPVMLFLFWFGFMYLGQYLPPPSADLPAEDLVALLKENLFGFRLGMMVTMIGFTGMITWGMAVATRLRPLEQGFPILTYVQIAAIAVSALIGMGSTWIFQAAAYRLDDTSPELVRMIHDLAWFTFLTPWPSFTVWCFCQAALIFRDKRAEADFPRWVGYVCIWVGILFIPACLPYWYKSGPFSWNGAIAFYLPVGVFFIWVVPLTYYGIKAVKRGAESPSAAFNVSHG